MPEYLDDPSVLTKDKLRQELLAHSVEPPAAGATKDAYVQLYLKTLTARNGRTTTASPMDGFSSDEDLPPPPPVVHSSSSRSSGRKAVRKTDKVQSDGLDVAELTAEGLKDELLKYGVDAGPIVASTRRVYEKKLLRLLDESISPASPELPPAQTETGANHNGHTDADQFSDKEDEETRVIPEPEPEVIPEPEPLPEPIPLVERLVRSRGKTPVTTRTRSSQHNKVCSPTQPESNQSDSGQTNDALEDDEVLNVKRRYRRSSYRVEAVPPPSCQTIGPNNMCSVPGDEPQTRPLSSRAKTDPAPSPSRTSQRSSEDSAAVRRSSVVLKERQPPTAKTPQIKPSEAPRPSPGPHRKEQSSCTAPPRLMDVPLDTTFLELTRSTGKPTPPAAPKTPSRAPPPLVQMTRVHPLASNPMSVTTTTPTRSHLPTRPLSLGRGECATPLVCTTPPEKERTNAHVAKGKQQKITPFLSDLSPVKRHGCVAVVSKESYFNKVEKVVVVDQTPRAEERDVLKEVFANDINSPTGILASCRKPIRGAAGRPIQPSDFWKDENLLLSPKSISTTTSSTSSYSETRHRSNLTLPTLPSSSLSASRLVATAPPAGQTKAARRGFSIWLKLFFLVLLVSFLFFVYQTMETDVLSPFSRSETEQVGTEGTA